MYSQIKDRIDNSNDCLPFAFQHLHGSKKGMLVFIAGEWEYPALRIYPTTWVKYLGLIVGII